MLTAKLISSAAPGSTHWDEQVKGLHLRVQANGQRAFYVYYRTRSGQQRRPKIGDASVISLDQARTTAKELLARVALGADPSAERRAERGASTVAELADMWLETLGKHAKPRTVHESDRIVERYVKPGLGALKCSTVQHDDVARLHRSMSDTPYMANRVLAALSAMFNLAETKGVRQPGTNPCRGVRSYKESSRRRYMRADEAPRVAAELTRVEATRPAPVAFIYLLILSGARPEEIARARWDWVERVGEGGVLRLPDSKVGARSVYLSPHIMDLLRRLPRDSDTITGIKSPKKLWDAIRVQANVPDLRLYDLRHTFASAALKAGYTLDQIGELLGHASTQTTKRYAHLVDEKAHEAASATSGLLVKMLSGTK